MEEIWKDVENYEGLFQVSNFGRVRSMNKILDLCDGTFCGIAKAFEKIGVSKDRLNISVIHMVNAKGIENLSKYFNHVWFTNSYKDWDNLPNNVTLINLI